MGTTKIVDNQSKNQVSKKSNYCTFCLLSQLGDPLRAETINRGF